MAYLEPLSSRLPQIVHWDWTLPRPSTAHHLPVCKPNILQAPLDMAIANSPLLPTFLTVFSTPLCALSRAIATDLCKVESFSLAPFPARFTAERHCPTRFSAFSTHSHRTSFLRAIPLGARLSPSTTPAILQWNIMDEDQGNMPLFPSAFCKVRLRPYT